MADKSSQITGSVKPVCITKMVIGVVDKEIIRAPREGGQKLQKISWRRLQMSPNSTNLVSTKESK